MNRLIDNWKLMASVGSIAIALSTMVWKGGIFFSETQATNAEFRALKEKVDSLNLEIYILKLKDDGNLLEYNIIKGSRP